MKNKRFYDRMKILLKDEYFDFEKALKSDINKGIRLNSLQIDKNAFEELVPFEIKPVSWCNEGYYLENIKDKPGKHPYYYAGLYYLQEPSAMIPVEALDINPGDKVLDISAAPGGKSTQICSKLHNKGLLVANDINPKRTIALYKNISLFGCKNSIVTNQKPENLEKVFRNYFNKILVDAPCSGEGLIKKDVCNYEDNHEKYVAMQKDILSSVHNMLEVNGELVYSTCTFNPHENEGIISWFIKKYRTYQIVDINIQELDAGKPEWIGADISLKKLKRAWPHKIRGEGHFIAKLRKIDGDKSKCKSIFKTSDNNLEQFYSFEKEFGLNLNYNGNMHNINNTIYMVPNNLIDLKSIKTVNVGVKLGEIKGKNFIPSQELSLMLKKDGFSNIINLDCNDIRVTKYLKGETIEYSNSKKGWNLICVDGYSLGFGKSDGDMIKNNYKKQWRML